MEQKRYKVILAKHADIMLQAHTEFLAKVSTVAARRLLADFIKVMDMLEINPLQFPYADELDVPGIPPETYRKCLFDERYKAIFLIEGIYVHVDAVIDCRQENSELF